MNVREAARRAGVSVRTLHYYEETGLIAPARNGENGYRIYDEETVHRVRLARAYRELRIPLKEVRVLLDASAEARDEILRKHYDVLERQRVQLDNRMALLNAALMYGAGRLAEQELSTLDQQMETAKRRMEESNLIETLKARLDALDEEEQKALFEEQLRLIAEIGNTDGGQAIEALRSLIERYYYPCTGQILQNFAAMYGGDGALGRMVDAIGGEGAGRRARLRIESWLNQKEEGL